MIEKKIKEKSSHYDDMLLALIPIVLCSAVMYGGRVLLVCVAGFATARIVDVWVAVMRHSEIDASDKSSTVAAITFCMLLPVSIPLYIVIMTVAMVTLIGKHVFGGKDVYPFSLAALSMCVAAVNWPDEVFKAVKPFTEVNFWSGASASTISGAGTIKMGGLPYISTLDLLLGNYAGTMGAAFVIIIFAVAVFLLATKRITWHVPVSFLITCTLFALAFPRIYGISRLESLKFEMLSGAIIFSSVFMLNEPATTPKNPKAKIVFGILTGVLSMLFRYFGSYEIGVCFALLLVNAVEGYIDDIFVGEKFLLKKLFLRQAAAEDEPEKPNHIYKSEPAKTEETSKPTNRKAVKAADRQTASKKSNKKKTKDTTLDIISQAEDSIDQVSFSTQTIDMEEALRIFDERYNKEGK